MPPFFKIIFIGDIVGQAGRKAVNACIEELKTDNIPVIVSANAENAAAGFGLTQKIYNALLSSGIDFMTGGNHIWDRQDLNKERSLFPCLALPANIRKDAQVHAAVHFEKFGVKITIINIVGRVFMPPGAEDPFKTFDEIYEKECEDRVVFVDFHAEATSEKIAFAHYVNGRAAAVVGTHTHVQTADERILPDGGTFFISDLGSCCAQNSILGMTTQSSLARFLTGENSKMSVELKPPYILNGVSLTVDTQSGKVTDFSRINKLINHS